MKNCSASNTQPSLSTCKNKSTCHRTGTMIIEVIVASILMASLVAIFLPGLAAINRQRLSIRDDALVLIELNNLAEHASVVSPDSLALSEWFQARYPTAKLQITPVAATVEFQPSNDDQVDGSLTFDNGLTIKITVGSQTANLPITRSLVVWPQHTSAQGANE